MKKFNLFVEDKEVFSPTNVENTHKELPSGVYSPAYDSDFDRVLFNKINLNSDDLVNLPSKELQYVVNQMNSFLTKEAKQKYEDNGFLYKRSFLLHGKPGTGKTCLVARIIQEALKKDAVVLFNPDPQDIKHFYQSLDDTNPDRLTLVIFEEFDDIVKNDENALLSILDGEVQKRNVIYLATTNYLEEIPLRIQRPGRFSSIVEIKFPDADARNYYLKTKRIDNNLINKWVEMTEGFSIDEVKETVLAVKCLDESLESVVERMRDLKARGLEAESKREEKEENQYVNTLSSLIGRVTAPGRKRG